MDPSSKRQRTPPVNLWCIRLPSGRLALDTLSDSQRGAYFGAFDYMPDGFRERYWKRPEAAQRAYPKHGYQAVRVRISIAEMPR